MRLFNFSFEFIEYFGYKPKEIQTDNGIEFTYNKADIKKEHPLERILKELGIKHHKIQPRTPEHNGKVERSHRNDNERFYSYLKFYSL
jgi:transposase InsO family protein